MRDVSVRYERGNTAEQAQRRQVFIQCLGDIAHVCGSYGAAKRSRPAIMMWMVMGPSPLSQNPTPVRADID